MLLIKEKILKKFSFYIVFFIGVIFFSACVSTKNTQKSKKIIIYVWDGLRGDIFTDPKANIPNLRALAHAGVEFRLHHSAYPTFTMNNAQALATGTYAGKSGFYGNVIYAPWRAQQSDKYGPAFNAKGKDITKSFLQPVHTEDYKLLQSLDKSDAIDTSLVQVITLLEQAHKSGLTTAVIGKSGPVFFQDYKSEGYILDENHVWPLSFVKELQQENIPLPKNSPIAFKQNELILSQNNTSPTQPGSSIYLKEEYNNSNPKAAFQSPFNNSNQYMADIFLNQILPKKSPDLSILWLRNPDGVEHLYGPGTAAYYDALEANDKILGQLRDKLKELAIENNTDIIVLSDHGHSSVVATKLNDSKGIPRLMYPMHNIDDNGMIGGITLEKRVSDKLTKEKKLITQGYSVSGIVRTADLITAAQLKTAQGKLIQAYDGSGCAFNFFMSGILNKNGKPNFNSKGYHAADGNCLDKNKKDIAYTSKSYFVPENLKDKNFNEKVIIAPNGGTDYVYIPSHDPEVAKLLVNFFQRREEYSALFVDDKRYLISREFITGVLPLSSVNLQNNIEKNPDIVVSLTANSQVIVNGLSGVGFSSLGNSWVRGSHGSFGQIDIHNFLIAYGPDFKTNFVDEIPTGNVDIAPTVANILQLNLPNTDGRVLLESLKNSQISQEDYTVTSRLISSTTTCNLNMYYPTTHGIDFTLDKQEIDNSVDTFFTQIQKQIVRSKDKQYFTYFDYAEGRRIKGCIKNLDNNEIYDAHFSDKNQSIIINDDLVKEARKIYSCGVLQMKNNFLYLKTSEDYIQKLYPLLMQNLKKFDKKCLSKEKGKIGSHITFIAELENRDRAKIELQKEYCFKINNLIKFNFMKNNLLDTKEPVREEWYGIRISSPEIEKIMKSIDLRFKRPLHISIAHSKKYKNTGKCL